MNNLTKKQNWEWDYEEFYDMSDLVEFLNKRSLKDEDFTVYASHGYFTGNDGYVDSGTWFGLLFKVYTKDE